MVSGWHLLPSAMAKWALEIHLPQLVGLLLLEAAIGLVGFALLRRDASTALEDLRCGASRRQVLIAFVLQIPYQLPASPGKGAASAPPGSTPLSPQRLPA